MADSVPPEGVFPLEALVPKKETGAQAFLTKLPNYDGRDVTIAILDTGVDPGAPGLQVTSTGQRKMIDCIDASGSGDVDTSTTVTTCSTPCDEDIEIQGVSRRKLQLNNQWQNPTGMWHVGVKLLEQLFPSSVNTRIKKREEENSKFNVSHQQAVAQATLDLEKWSTAHPSPNQEEKDHQDELQARLDVLSSVMKKTSIGSAAVDVVAFHDGDNWRVAIGVEESGDMTGVEPLLPFRLSGKYSTFAGDAMVNYTVDVFDEGATVAIVVASGSHGSHVAGISAACFPDEPVKNGVAAGAQILSVKIGDTRLSTMETGTAFVRAAIAVVKYKCDVVNLSYGEGAHLDNVGHSVKVLADLAKKHGIVFVCSAGNNGPCMSTVGCPGGTTSEMIGVGAYVSPQMMEAQYGMLEKCPGQNYTWSSTGPSADGNLGVDISAPGGAITSVPTWTLKNHVLMNGTSMSSPNAAGCVALILSGLKDNGVPYSAFSVRRALINTAHLPSGASRFNRGHGMIQVEPAYEWLRRYHDVMEHDIWFEVSVALPRRSRQRGIYLRDGYESLSQPITTSVTVTPHYPREHADFVESQLALDLRLSLVSSESWVTVCPYLALPNSSRTFQVSVDTRGLGDGEHYAEVRAFDSVDPSRGPLFRVPVSVLVPKSLTDRASYKETLVFTSGTPQRRFFRVPESATYVDIVVSSNSPSVARYNVHGIQLEPKARYCEHQLYKSFVFSAPSEVQKFQGHVLGGAMLELCFAKWWANSSAGEIAVTIQFNSLRMTKAVSCIQSNDGFQKVLVRNGLGPCVLKPQCSLTHLVSVYTPCERKTVLPLGERDVDSQGSPSYELQLTYKFQLSSKSQEVSPQFRWLESMLYESDYHGQLWMLFDCNKRYITSGDAFADRYTTKLEKGEYTLKLQVRHHNSQRLDILKDLPLSVATKLSNAISLDIYESQSDMLQSLQKFTSRIVPSGETIPLFLVGSSLDKLPSGAKTNSILEGHLTFSKPFTSSSSKSTEAVDRHPFSLCVHNLAGEKSKSSTSALTSSASNSSSSLASSSSASSKDSCESEEKEKPDDKYREALRDFSIGWMSKSGDVQQFADLAQAFPDHLPLFSAHLNAVYSRLEKEGCSAAAAVITSANKVISMIDVKEMASAYYRKKDSRCDAATVKSGAEKNRQCLQDALFKKGMALHALFCGTLPKSASSSSSSLSATEAQNRQDVLKQFADSAEDGSGLPLTEEDVKRQLTDVISNLETWFDLFDAKIVPLTVKYFQDNDWHGRALSAFLKTMDTPASANLKSEEELCKMLDKLGYSHLSTVRRTALHTKYPPAALPF
ncbi:tripeptidyl-peptidase 2-like isoform X1 [Sycon ciliatum]|uniref:tripeptidyl-peptidase 2-like isoform X1 n=2 Tax=Sycon ciliatum TaxID=27933 RepID=UPI0031F63EB6